jgi:hypothetical protein
MANKDWAFGLQPIQTLSGGVPWTESYPIKATSTKMYRGQAVIWSTSGYFRVYTTAIPAAGSRMAVSAEYYSGSATMPTKTTGLFWRADQHIFAINSDASTAGAATMLNKWYDLSSIASGSTITGNSTCELDWNTSSLTSTYTTPHFLKVLGPHRVVGDTAYASHTVYKVQLCDGQTIEKARGKYV